MGRLILRYGDLGEGVFEEEFDSAEIVITRLEEIREHYNAQIGMPYAVDLVRCGSGVLSVGLGDGLWILSYTPNDGPCLMSFGDESAEGTVQFFFGDVTALSRKYLISREKALMVIQAWCDRGELSDSVIWTENLFLR